MKNSQGWHQIARRTTIHYFKKGDFVEGSIPISICKKVDGYSGIATDKIDIYSGGYFPGTVCRQCLDLVSTCGFTAIFPLKAKKSLKHIKVRARSTFPLFGKRKFVLMRIVETKKQIKFRWDEVK